MIVAIPQAQYLSAVANKMQDKCIDCRYCETAIACAKILYSTDCIGCGACATACQVSAISMVTRHVEEYVTIQLDDDKVTVPQGISIKAALLYAGYTITKYPDKGAVFVPCETGGCFACAVVVNDKKLVRSCITPVANGLKITTDTAVIAKHAPVRIVHGFQGHPVGGVGTPWQLKGYDYIECACFTAGCNFRCPQCQNWTTTYASTPEPLTPRDTATLMTATANRLNVDRLAISGGECTLNRRWLVSYIRELRKLNSNSGYRRRRRRIHVDTNASILTPDYIDELIAAGMTDIGIDIKGMTVDTFIKITNVHDRTLARRYLDTEWTAAKYVIDTYSERVFIGIGIPYNKSLISHQEIQKMGERIAAIDPDVQVCVLDYRPEFRRKSLHRPSREEMNTVHKILKSTGLNTVICQTIWGYIGP
jgi:pyruvate formate lyase activating enzyme